MTDCLLSDPNYGMDDKYKTLIGEMLDTIGTDSGCYLYYNNNRKKWIRSGKVSGRQISERLEKHKKEGGQQITGCFTLSQTNVSGGQVYIVDVGQKRVNPSYDVVTDHP